MTEAVRVGSVELCPACWKRDGHEPGCERLDQQWFFHELALTQPYRVFTITGITPQEKRMTISKDDFATLSNRFESVGLLPKGKTADLLENFDFVLAQAEAEAKAAAGELRDDERTTDPEFEPVSKKRSK
jgi:hypothetical protein